MKQQAITYTEISNRKLRLGILIGLVAACGIFALALWIASQITL